MTNDIQTFWKDKSILVLSGGVGGAKLVHGLARILPESSLSVAVNTGDDFDWMGLWICPDLDTVLYTLSGRAPLERGWGIEGDSFQTLSALKRLGGSDWFLVGDQDLSVHLLRNQARQEGVSLSEITRQLFAAHKLRTHVFPMAETPHPTFIEDPSGHTYSFQDWLVRRRAEPVAHRVILEGSGTPSDALVQSIEQADVVILPPSNPFVSIDPILRLDGVRAALRQKPVIGVAPILGDQAIKGPLAEMIPSLLQRPASVCALADYYRDLLDYYLVAPSDLGSACAVPLIGCDILMGDVAGRERLARDVLAEIRRHDLLAAKS